MLKEPKEYTRKTQKALQQHNAESVLPDGMETSQGDNDTKSRKLPGNYKPVSRLSPTCEIILQRIKREEEQFRILSNE